MSPARSGPAEFGAIGLGLIGLGRWSRAHAAAAARSDRVRIVACHSRRADHAARFASEFGIDRAVGSFAELLAEPDVEAVIIATPNDLHVDMALSAMAAGKPALVDKPVCVDLAGGLRLLRAGPTATQVGVAHHARRLGGIRRMKQWLGSEAGAARFAAANFSNARGAALPDDVWYTRIAGAEAGVLIQVGIHQVDNLLWLFGPAISVNARLDTAPGDDLPKGAVVVLSHASGVISTVTSSWTTPGLFAIEIQATEGNLRYRLDHRHWSEPDVDDHGTLLLDRQDGHDQIIGQETANSAKTNDPLLEQLDELGAAARGEGAMEVDVAAGVRAMVVVLAAVRSSRNDGGAVTIERLLTEAGATAEEVELLTTPEPEIDFDG